MIINKIIAITIQNNCEVKYFWYFSRNLGYYSFGIKFMLFSESSDTLKIIHLQNDYFIFAYKNLYKIFLSSI